MIVFYVASVCALCFLDESSQQTVKVLGIPEGDVCKQDQGLGIDYVCTRPEKCESLPKNIKENDYPPICSFTGKLPIICCHRATKESVLNYTTKLISNTINGSAVLNSTTESIPNIADKSTGFNRTTEIIPNIVDENIVLNRTAETNPNNVGERTVFNRTTERTPNIVDEKCLQYSELAKKHSKKLPMESKSLQRRSTDVPSNDGQMIADIQSNTTNNNTDMNKKPIVFVHNILIAEGDKGAEPMEFPHMVLLGFGETIEEERWGCGGSLISERWILTAAHCRELGFEPARWARLGDLNINLKTDIARPVDYRIDQHVLHPDYRPSSLYNDIALFRLETDVIFSEFVRPICLNTDPSLNPKVQTATGWGKTAFGGPPSEDLLKVDLDIVPVDKCNISYYPSVDSRLEFGILDDSMICAGSADGDKDTCDGDSGGPLQAIVADNLEMYTQFGITSFGRFCGDKDTPSVYTRVSKYVSWIEEIVWPKL